MPKGKGRSGATAAEKQADFGGGGLLLCASKALAWMMASYYAPPKTLAGICSRARRARRLLLDVLEALAGGEHNGCGARRSCGSSNKDPRETSERSSRTESLRRR